MSTATVHVLVLADTHLSAANASRLIERLPASLARADQILHAGDIVDAAVLDQLAAHAPVHAVLGNNDHGVLLPERLTLQLGGCEMAMVHDSGPSAGRANRLQRWFPTADVVVFGHSHIPWNHEHSLDSGVTSSGATVQHHVNPGSAMQRRKQPRCTIAWLELGGGEVRDIRHITVPGPDA